MLAVALLAGCAGPSGPEAGVAPPSPSPGTTAPAASPDAWDGPVEATAETVVEGLPTPWGLAALPEGRLLVSLRDEARLVVVDPATGGVADVTGPGAERLAADTRPQGEGGLLGVAVQDDQVFVHRTGADDNAVLRGTLDGTVLGPLAPVVEGIPKAGNHNGGRLGVGPDGYLYVATGDAGDRDAAQDESSLGGKILRVTPDGEPAPGNPYPGSPVWSLGHRNVQGLGWDAGGRLFASEFGQNTLDELNLVEPGANYGWPQAEGPSDGAFADPVAWWPTSDASPSGLAVTQEAVYLAGLRGERLWRVPLLGSPADVASGGSPGFGEPQALLTGEHGRLRSVLPVPGRPGELYVLTNETDGRGSPEEGDDRLLRVTLSPAE